jgi:hypothetical protein
MLRTVQSITAFARALYLLDLLLPPLDNLYSAVQQAGQIRDAMALSNFLNPADEAITEVDERSSDPEMVLDEVLEQYIPLAESANPN